MITPNAGGWHVLAEAEYERALGRARPQAWADAAATWERLERPPLAAYCRWRQAEALVAAGASRAEATAPLRDAHAIAARTGVKPLAAELQLLAQRARLDLAPPDPRPPDGKRALEQILGLTPREADVLTLVARGCTNREIAVALVISVKTASVHISHILRKLDAPNRLEAAAIAHRLAPNGPTPGLTPLPGPKTPRDTKSCPPALSTRPGEPSVRTVDSQQARRHSKAWPWPSVPPEAPPPEETAGLTSMPTKAPPRRLWGSRTQPLVLTWGPMLPARIR